MIMTDRNDDCKLVTEYTPPLEALETAGEASSTKYSLADPESKQH